MENLGYTVEAGSYQVEPLCLCSSIIWSSRSPHLLHMIWYSGAHWSMADCSVSSSFTLSHIPTSELLELDLRTWIDSDTPFLSFWVTPVGCRSTRWAWIAWHKSKKISPKKSYILCKRNTKKSFLWLLPVISCLGFWNSCVVSRTPFSPSSGKSLFWIPIGQPHRNWS